MPLINLTKSHVGNYLLSCYSIETVKRRYFNNLFDRKDSVSFGTTYFGADLMTPTGNTLMFTKKPNQSSEPKLEDIAKKVFHTGYIFDEINGDLGAVADEIAKSSKRIFMAYGYARRSAAAALYIQGHFDKEAYDYVHSIFKSIQLSTEHSIEFQEQASADAIAYIQTYHPIINNIFINTMISIAQDYEVPPGYLDDDDLIEEVLEIIAQEEKQIVSKYENLNNTINYTDLFEEVKSNHAAQNEADWHNLDRFNEIISILTELSDYDDQKSETMWIMPLNRKWSYEFHFSEEKIDITHKLSHELYELYELMDGKVQMPTFQYHKK